PVSLTDEALALLCRYHFPGNIRELHTAIERAAAICEGQTIRPEDLPDRILESSARTSLQSEKPFLTQRRDEVECAEVRKAVASSRTQREAAEKLGRSERWLRDKLKECGHSR